jgi:hypothetical protein
MSQPNSQPLDLNQLAHARFREAFGESRTVGEGEQWSLMPAYPGNRINIVLNGTRNGAALWIFDPHDPEGAVSASITEARQINELIEQLHERVRRASQFPPQRHQSATPRRDQQRDPQPQLP